MSDAARIHKMREELRVRLEADFAAERLAVAIINEVERALSLATPDALREIAMQINAHRGLLRSEARDARMLFCLEGVLREMGRR